jgi:hypothetical protein
VDDAPGPPDELRRALQAGTKLRLLVIVCPRNHALARVYAGTDGPWLVVQQSALIVTPSEHDPSTPRESFTSRVDTMYWRLADVADWAEVEAVCRCRRVRLNPGWVQQQLDAGCERARVLT